MKRIDLSQINFPLETKRYTKKIKEIIQLFGECKYDEAEALAAKLNGYDPQLADMRAQLAFFRSDFNECVQQGLMVYPFLNEWYSGNKRKQTELMLEYALQMADESIRQEAIEILTEMHGHFTDEQLSTREFEHFKYIPILIEHAEGSLESFAFRLYTPPESPKELSVLADEYLTLHKKRFAKLQGNPMDNLEVVSGFMVSVFSQCRPEDYLALYEKHYTSPKLNNCHFSAAQIYIFLKQEGKAREALVNYAKYGFIPIEWTDIKPMEIFYDYSFVPLFNKELFRIIYNLPVPQLSSVRIS